MHNVFPLATRGRLTWLRGHAPTLAQTCLFSNRTLVFISCDSIFLSKPFHGSVLRFHLTAQPWNSMIGTHVNAHHQRVPRILGFLSNPQVPPLISSHQRQQVLTTAIPTTPRIGASPRVPSIPYNDSSASWYDVSALPAQVHPAPQRTQRTRHPLTLRSPPQPQLPNSRPYLSRLAPQSPTSRNSRTTTTASPPSSTGPWSGRSKPQNPPPRPSRAPASTTTRRPPTCPTTSPVPSATCFSTSGSPATTR